MTGKSLSLNVARPCCLSLSTDYKAGLQYVMCPCVHVSKIDTHEPGAHAVGTIHMTLQLGMLPCCTPTEAKERSGGL